VNERVNISDLRRDLAGAVQSHRRLLAALETLTDDQVAAPSRLEGWTVGHVLTHLARNADSHVRMVAAAERGEITDQYEGGAISRTADIDRGARRTAVELVDDLTISIERLEACWDVTTDVAWAGSGRSVGGPLTIASLPFRRWREAEVHHVDLGLGYDLHRWPNDYVRIELGLLTMQWSSRRPMGLTQLPPEAMVVSDRTRLAWLLGRLDIEGLPAAGIVT
jgi:maleylpyruvate isomerase